MLLLISLLIGCSPNTDLPLEGTWVLKLALTDAAGAPGCGEWLRYLTLTEDHRLYLDEYVEPIFDDTDTGDDYNNCVRHQNTYKFWRRSEGSWEQFDLGNTHQLGVHIDAGYLSPISANGIQLAEASYGVETSWTQYPVALADEGTLLYLKGWATFEQMQRIDIEGPWDTSDTGGTTDPGPGFP